MAKQRHLHQQIADDLKRKMVFLGGPRQVGKTTLSQSFFSKSDTGYLNWDIPKHRDLILSSELPDTKLIIFDEIHKYKKWRNYLKGIYDGMKADVISKRQILVTGSARLDYYRFGGDSLQGRYNYLRLLPLSYDEIKGSKKNDVQALMVLSGFPEPFFSESEKELRRWSREYIQRLIKEDISGLEATSDLGTLEVLAKSLPLYVGSPLSINNLRENLQVAHKTVSKWIAILERLYLVFRITSFTGNLIKSVTKEQKLYFYNWTYVNDESMRFENLVAVHLLKYCYWQEDTQGFNYTLHFSKQKNSPEVDFVVCKNDEPEMFIEAKLSDQEINPRFAYLKTKYPKAQFFQLHLHGKKDFKSADGVRVCPAHIFFDDYARTSL